MLTTPDAGRRGVAVDTSSGNGSASIGSCDCATEVRRAVGESERFPRSAIMSVSRRDRRLPSPWPARRLSSRRRLVGGLEGSDGGRPSESRLGASSRMRQRCSRWNRSRQMRWSRANERHERETSPAARSDWKSRCRST